MHNQLVSGEPCWKKGRTGGEEGYEYRYAHTNDKRIRMYTKHAFRSAKWPLHNYEDFAFGRHTGTVKYDTSSVHSSKIIWNPQTL